MKNSITPLKYLKYIAIAEDYVSYDPELAQTIIWIGDNLFDNSLLSRSPFRALIKRRYNELISAINHSIREHIEINNIKRLAGLSNTSRKR